MKIREKIKSVLCGITDCFVDVLVGVVEMNSAGKKDTVDKVRVFKPTISDGVFGKSITWEEREKPLTNEELKLMYKVEDKYLE